MENKYYTPDIEDFRIGYQCEVNWNRGYEEDFIPIILKICDELEGGKRDCYCSNVDDVLIAYDDGYAEFRTLFLTKEQIENDDFLYIGVVSIFKENNTLSVSYVNFQKKNIYLKYEIINNQLLIFKYHKDMLYREYLQLHDLSDSPFSQNYLIFKGDCKSINEFRYICNILNI